MEINVVKHISPLTAVIIAFVCQYASLMQEIGMSLASQHFIKMDCRTIISCANVPNKQNRELAKNAKILKSEISCDSAVRAFDRIGSLVINSKINFNILWKVRGIEWKIATPHFS